MLARAAFVVARCCDDAAPIPGPRDDLAVRLVEVVVLQYDRAVGMLRDSAGSGPVQLGSGVAGVTAGPVQSPASVA